MLSIVGKSAIPAGSVKPDRRYFDNRTHKSGDQSSSYMHSQHIVTTVSPLFRRGTPYPGIQFETYPKRLLLVVDVLSSRDRASLRFLGLAILSAIILDALPICKLALRWWQITTKRRTYHRGPVLDLEKGIRLSLRELFQRRNPPTRQPLIDAILLLSAKILALLQWLFVQCIEPRLPSSFAVDDLQRVPALAVTISNLQASLWIPHLLLFGCVLSSTFALLLLAKRSHGPRRTVVFVSYGLSNILGVVIWINIGATSVEYFTALMPLTMSVGASLGIACSG